jgi:fluoride exporter
VPIFNRHPKRKLAAIYAGGILGALARVGLAQAFPHAPTAWPWPTFGVNMIGALSIGYLFASFRDHTPDQLRHPFFATGICGTLTTFSTVQLELYAMVDHGHLGLAGLYCGGTLALGYLAVRAGMGIERLSPREARA